MGLTDDVRASCRAIAERARFVSIEVDRLGELEPAPPPSLDPERYAEWLAVPVEKLAESARVPLTILPTQTLLDL